MTTNVQKELAVTLADTYALYLKTQNYHWHVSGENFGSLHQLFEHQYKELAEAIDTLAERIVTLQGQAPATFRELLELSTLKEGDSKSNSQAMLTELEADHRILIKQLNNAIAAAKNDDDEGTIAFLSERIAAHEKNAWMLRASEG